MRGVITEAGGYGQFQGQNKQQRSIKAFEISGWNNEKTRARWLKYFDHIKKYNTIMKIINEGKVVGKKSKRMTMI